MSKRHPEAGPIAADNNKRLAHLEAGVSALAIAVAAVVGVKVEEIEDPFAAAEGAFATMKAKIDELDNSSAEIGRLGEYLLANHGDAIEGSAVDTAIKILSAVPASAEEVNDGAIESLKAQLADVQRVADAQGSRITELTAEVGELEHDLADMTGEKNRLANELAAALEGRPSAPPADPVVEAPAAPIARERPEAARDVGPDYQTLTIEELNGLVAAQAHGLELAFSNGEYEILSLEPIPLAVTDLVPAEGKLMVSGAIFAKLQATDPQEELAGVGLLIGGEQIAYCPFIEKLRLEPGNERRFERAITF